MKRLAFYAATAAAAFGFGACEKHSANNLPEHYQHKGGQHAEPTAGHDAAPAKSEKHALPAGDHKS